MPRQDHAVYDDEHLNNIVLAHAGTYRTVRFSNCSMGPRVREDDVIWGFKVGNSAAFVQSKGRQKRCNTHTRKDDVGNVTGQIPSIRRIANTIGNPAAITLRAAAPWSYGTLK